MLENIFLNPNIAYLFLVGGFSLALLAILSPGTGLLELGAFFSLLLAGYGIYNLPINYWALVILLLGVFPFIWAVRKSGQMVFLGISILALVVGSAYLFKGSVWWQPAVNPILALVASLLVGGFFWIAARKTLEADAAPPSHDLRTLVGALGEAKSEIHHEGSAQVQGELWAARSENPIPDGALIRVNRRDGFILDVVQVEEDTHD
jgi:membrane-bound serine protease (ClpP class)